MDIAPGLSFPFRGRTPPVNVRARTAKHNERGTHNEAHPLRDCRLGAGAWAAISVLAATTASCHRALIGAATCGGPTQRNATMELASPPREQDGGPARAHGTSLQMRQPIGGASVLALAPGLAATMKSIVMASSKRSALVSPRISSPERDRLRCTALQPSQPHAPVATLRACQRRDFTKQQNTISVLEL